MRGGRGIEPTRIRRGTRMIGRAYHQPKPNTRPDPGEAPSTDHRAGVPERRRYNGEAIAEAQAQPLRCIGLLSITPSGLEPVTAAGADRCGWTADTTAVWTGFFLPGYRFSRKLTARFCQQIQLFLRKRKGNKKRHRKRKEGTYRTKESADH